MSKIIYVCGRYGLPASTERRLRAVCKTLEPDNIVPVPPRVAAHGTCAYGVMNPSPWMREGNGSVAVGQMLGGERQLERALSSGEPDGSFALFRNSGDRLDVMSDPAASRTIWHYKDEEKFVASTSQRAIVMFLGSFDLDERVIPWMLSTGGIGPYLSWDRRLEMMRADSRVTLNKRDWSLSATSAPIEFVPSMQPEREHERALREALEYVFDAFDVDLSQWALPLSGGYDTRAILCMLRDSGKDIDRLRTVTWGLASSQGIAGSDATVAKALADAVGVPHQYYPTDLTDEPAEKVIDRFVLMGEGRTDHLSAHTDGFAVWKALFEAGVRGEIRGHEGMGEPKPYVFTDSSVRRSIDFPLCSDYRNLKDYKDYGFADQAWPQILDRRARNSAETNAAWLDRLNHSLKLPTILTAWSDLKLSYVEVACPLLSRALLRVTRQLPDALRAKKALFKKIVVSMSPNLEIATRSAIATPQQVLRDARIAAIIREELSSANARTLLPAPFLDGVSNRVETGHLGTSRSRAYISKARKLVWGREVDPNILAFRVFLVSRMNAVLREDSSRLGGRIEFPKSPRGSSSA